MTHKEFSETDNVFKEACKRAGVLPTTRQASKWHLKKGRAYKEGRGDK